jgi:hypothetical protein
MAFIPTTSIKFGPFGAPIEGQTIIIFVQVIQLLEVLESDYARSMDVKKSKGYIVFGIGLREEVFEIGPVR